MREGKNRGKARKEQIPSRRSFISLFWFFTLYPRITFRELYIPDDDTNVLLDRPKLLLESGCGRGMDGSQLVIHET